jgi:hypothetical protein
VVRLYYSISVNLSNDSTWEGFDLWTWETVELDLGIVCASFPSLKALVTRMLPKLLGSSKRDENGVTTIGGHPRRERGTGGALQGLSTNGVGEYGLDEVTYAGRNGRGGLSGGRESQEGLTKGS